MAEMDEYYLSINLLLSDAPIITVFYTKWEWED
jgi:hypothetical protein